MSWGYKILMVIVVFVCGILFLVYQSSRRGSELVTTDYYEKELVYQNTIDAKSNVNNLGDTVVFHVVNDELSISFPRDFAGQKIDGQATLYYPSDQSKDMVHTFSMQDSKVVFPVNAGNKKEFNLQLGWQSRGKNYYFEKRIVIK
ncbi:MAG: FixH family protein [Ginsengibacter sp.]